MGTCASRHNKKTTTTTTSRGGGGRVKGDVGFRTSRASESFRRPSWIMVIDIKSGAIKEYKKPIAASVVVLENGGNNGNGFYLSNAESMCIGTRVADDEELVPGRLYFLVPISYSNYPLSLPLLCDLAVKVSSALFNNANQ